MHNILLFARLFLSLLKPEHDIYIENIILRKENEILKRRLNLKRIRLKKRDKLFFVLLNMPADIKGMITIFFPATLLSWQTDLYPHSHMAKVNPVRAAQGLSSPLQKAF